MTLKKDDYNFYVGKLSDDIAEQVESSHQLKKLDDSVFGEDMLYSAYGNNIKMSGVGTLIDDPITAYKLDLSRDKQLIKDVMEHKKSIDDKKIVVLAHVKASAARHNYFDKDGKKKTYVKYSYIPILATSETSKKILLNFEKGDHVCFDGSFYSTILKDENDEFTNKSTYWCILQNLYGFARRKKELDKELDLISDDVNSPDTFQKSAKDHVSLTRKQYKKALMDKSDK